MWTVNDCDASKKRKAFKNSDNGKLRGGGGAREGVGRERKGVEWPTPIDSLADRSNGFGQPAGRPRPRPCTRTGGRAAVRSGDAVKGFASTGRGRLPGRPRPCTLGIKGGTGRHSPTHLNGRAGCFGILCLIACTPLSVVVEFCTTPFFFLLFPFHCVLYFKNMRRSNWGVTPKGKAPEMDWDVIDNPDNVAEDGWQDEKETP